MATAEKHAARSHRSYRNTRGYFGTFMHNAAVKKQRVEQKSFFQELFHRIQNKGD